MKFTKASKKQAKLRLAAIGPSGSGKTYTSLKIASHLGKKIAVIDSERGSASKYAGIFEFDVLELDSFSPRTYVEAIHAAEEAGYDVVVIDSLSHAWMGKGGALEQVDNASKRGGNSYTAWRDVTPQHNALVDAIIGCKAHVLVTMRAKTEYVLEEDSRGKKVPKKVGMAAIQREGLEYEFDVVGDMRIEGNEFVVSKTRCPAMTGQVFQQPGKDVADILKAWLTDGAELPPAPEKKPVELAEETVVDEFAKRIAAAESIKELTPIATEIKTVFDEGDPGRASLSKLYVQRQKQLKSSESKAEGDSAAA